MQPIRIQAVTGRGAQAKLTTMIRCMVSRSSRAIRAKMEIVWSMWRMTVMGMRTMTAWVMVIRKFIALTVEHNHLGQSVVCVLGSRWSRDYPLLKRRMFSYDADRITPLH